MLFSIFLDTIFHLGTFSLPNHLRLFFSCLFNIETSLQITLIFFRSVSRADVISVKLFNYGAGGAPKIQNCQSLKRNWYAEIFKRNKKSTSYTFVINYLACIFQRNRKKCAFVHFKVMKCYKDGYKELYHYISTLAYTEQSNLIRLV